MSKEEIITLSIRLPVALRDRCKELAKARGVSMNEFIVQTLAQFEAGEALPAEAEMRLLARIERLEKAVKALEKK